MGHRFLFICLRTSSNGGTHQFMVTSFLFLAVPNRTFRHIYCWVKIRTHFVERPRRRNTKPAADNCRDPRGCFLGNTNIVFLKKIKSQRNIYSSSLLFAQTHKPYANACNLWPVSYMCEISHGHPSVYKQICLLPELTNIPLGRSLYNYVYSLHTHTARLHRRRMLR